MQATLAALMTALALFFAPIVQAFAAPSHAIAMHGQPALPADFTHLPYANPDAPKGGKISYAWPGTFDSVNPFIVQGSAARGTIDTVFGDLVFDRLMVQSADEPFTMYPLLAKSIETDDARSFAEFTLDERAKFSDGQPVTADDVIFSFELLRDKGYPRYAVSADKVAKVEKVGAQGVRFTFKAPDRELPLILARLHVLPKHLIDPATFDKSTLKPMVGSGPYTMAEIRPGDSITFKRNPDYWAKDLPSKRGFDNYDEIKLTYYRDENAMFEAFRKGLVDVFLEENSGRWKNEYDFPAATRGDVLKETFETRLPSGMYGIVMNTRRPIFADRALRAGLTELFDFEWVNRNLLSAAYRRTTSFFDNSELSSHGIPASEAERALLAPFPDAVTPDIMEHGWTPPASDGSGRDRKFLRVGFDTLTAAGYTLKDGRLVAPDGHPVSFEIMLKGKEGEQLAVSWQQTLAKLGIELVIRSVDASQFQQRQINYDYDAFLFNYAGSLSPGVEQVGRWGSETRDKPGTFNFAGVANPAVDAMISAMLQAVTREDFVTAVRAYDRVLLSGAYVIPLYFRPERWVAHWKRIDHPGVTPIQGPQLPTWWFAQ
ncbi:extracellular solute-binding protein [Mesorhizobium sp. GR13]|uniref:extracellular solute-binding protein n=1 Tax=Mesorhizobium sp. GR13 TaxID=2562308 RepID=UPI0010BFEE43|nr:extracellular solute-binding protein [Mesorhizobium sp. GR13]